MYARAIDVQDRHYVFSYHQLGASADVLEQLQMRQACPGLVAGQPADIVALVHWIRDSTLPPERSIYK